MIEAGQPVGSTFRGLVAVMAGLASFAAGCVAAVAVLMWAMTPSSGCAPPCDAPVYVALGLALFVAPIAGVVCAAASLFVLRRWWRRPVRHA